MINSATIKQSVLNMKLYKSGALTKVSLSELTQFTTSSCRPLIDKIGDVVQIKNFSSSCNVEALSHYFVLKTDIINNVSKIIITAKQQPGDDIKASNEAAELDQYKYEELREKAYYDGERYSGVLYGSVKTHSCETMIDCPSCGGTGICPRCDGEKQITCTVCEGSKECAACDGTGRYTCEHCDGSGNCPECDDGWVCCEYCWGEGTVSCPDCNGTGNYIDASCNHCGGWGTLPNGRDCPKCGGSGRFIKECRKCDGEGKIECSNCDGEGGWDCEECHGSGRCSHCHGEGSFTCKACKGTGICGKCRGRGKIWCPDCNGKGICFNCKGEKKVTCPKCLSTGKYQTYLHYSFREKNETKHYMNFPLEQDDVVQTTGIEIFDGVIYSFFAKRCNVFDVESAKLSLHDFPLSDIEKFEEWVRLENNSEFTKDRITDDYLNTRVINYRIPITKIILTCMKKNYTIYVVGNERMIYYDELPGTARLLFGKWFS